MDPTFPKSDWTRAGPNNVGSMTRPTWLTPAILQSDRLGSDSIAGGTAADACATSRLVTNEADTHDISLQLSVLRCPPG